MQALLTGGPQRCSCSLVQRVEVQMQPLVPLALFCSPLCVCVLRVFQGDAIASVCPYP